ncbi:hypothetical protein T4C_5073 [Trichinella pseudospiralis]|uniref:Uncharacterized protein n=1 Tax=Trichinella pseudospiralis TaxID=6337 RepID=A0A0V1J2M9_TRIPS|nr:hypothetical protein T4C_5073 [Trichinella pseudospiralis]
MSSNLGRLSRFTATRVFAATKFTRTDPGGVFNRSSKGTGTKARGSLHKGRSASSCFQLTQGRSTSSGRGSSQSAPFSHNDWKRILARTRKGARHPSGSETHAAALNICRFVFPPCGRIFSGSMNVRWSPLRSQKIPNVFPGQPPVPRAVFSAGTALRASGSLLAHLCRWKPPEANRESS